MRNQLELVEELFAMELSQKRLCNLALGLYGISLLIGIYICMNSSWWLAVSWISLYVDGLFIYRRSTSNFLYSIW